MFVSLNRSSLRFLHKHPMLSTIMALTNIEASHSDYTVLITCFTNVYFFDDFSDSELQTLYRNSTGEDLCLLHDDALKRVLCDICARLPITEVDNWEVVLQEKYANQFPDRAFKYVKGASLPAEMSDLWELPGLTTVKSPEEASIAGSAPNRAKMATAPAPSRLSVAPDKPTPRKQASAPRQGGVRERIWSVADAMWEKAGKPVRKEDVLSLRKRIMDELETQGIKRTSSSNELGNWQKAKVSRA